MATRKRRYLEQRTETLAYDASYRDAPPRQNPCISTGIQEAEGGTVSGSAGTGNTGNKTGNGLRKLARDNYRKNAERRKRQVAQRALRLRDIPNPRAGEPWTVKDDKTALRKDIGVVEIAYMLGRSYTAVSGRRHVLRHGRRRAA